jgi:hypothetical protein
MKKWAEPPGIEVIQYMALQLAAEIILDHLTPGSSIFDAEWCKARLVEARDSPAEFLIRLLGPAERAGELKDNGSIAETLRIARRWVGQ